jgi:glycogen(starch) synthase
MRRMARAGRPGKNTSPSGGEGRRRPAKAGPEAEPTKPKRRRKAAAPADAPTAAAAERAIHDLESAIEHVAAEPAPPPSSPDAVMPPLPPLSAAQPSEPPPLRPPVGSPPMAFYRPSSVAHRPAPGGPGYVPDAVPPPDPDRSPPQPPAVSPFASQGQPPQSSAPSPASSSPPNEPTDMRPRLKDVPRLPEPPATAPAVPVIPTPAPEKVEAKAPAPRPAPEPPPPPPPVAVEPPKPEPPKPPQVPAEPLLFEIAWEVCWQLGGIYTVLRTKAPAMLQRWGDRYCLIGPYNPQTAAYEFDEQPAEGLYRDCIEGLAQAGIPAKFGRWLIPGRPQVILVDYRARYASLDGDKYALWTDHGISTTQGDGEVNEVVAFGFSVAELFARLSKVVGGRQVLAHFHEWMAGVAIPRIAHLRLPVATVFTTHATLLGRYLAGDSPNFYEHLPYINAEEQAAKYQIYSKFQIERAATHACTVFTTVSEVTDAEAQQLLGRKADAIVPNGLNIQRFAALHEFQNLHQTYKERIHEFTMGHFFPSYTFDLDRTIYIVTSGRYEYRNKGFDLFIEAMFRLNQRLKQIPNAPTVVAFIITRAPAKHINVQTLQRQSMFEDLKNVCSSLERAMGTRMFRAAAQGRLPRMQDLLNDEELLRLRQSIQAWRSGPPPAIVTHDLWDDAGDAILRHYRHRGLFNGPEDPVKVIFHPEFVTATSPLFNLDYQQFVRGCHMGVFPSYYEPWGYTPMECVALGLPAVTTDLSGFGAYVQHHVPNAAHQGICVLNRRTKSFEETTSSLVDYLMAFAQMSRRQRIEMRNRVERLSELFDWSALVIHYHEAHDLALERGAAGRPQPGRVEVRFA